MTSLSRLGCFLLTGGRVEKKELIHLEIDVPDAEPMRLSGKVVDKADEIGFALQFTPPEKADRVRLRQFLAPLHKATRQEAKA